MSDKEPISIFVEKILPDYVVRDYPNFVAFIRIFLEYLEQNQYDTIDSLDEYTDIDETIDDFLEQFRQKYTPKLPQTLFEDTRFFIKNARDLYRKKGTEDSYRFLFKAVYGSDVELYYPGDDILRPSANTWYSPTYLITAEQNNLTEWVDHFIEGEQSGATGFVEKTSAVSHDGTIKTALSLINVDGTFVVGETITVTDDDSISSQTIDTNGIKSGQNRWLNNESFLSSTKYLQDNYYYQDFSYVLRSDISLQAYEDLVKEILHPAGMQLFGELPFLALEEMDVEEISIELVRWLIEWIREKEQQISLQLTEKELETLNNLYVVNNPFKVTYKYFEDNKEEQYFLKTWRIQDLDYHTIGDFEDYPNELIHPITQVAEITIN